jgi:DNA polymerase-3 subunit delta
LTINVGVTEKIEKLYPVYFLYGVESFLIEEALRDIRKKLCLGSDPSSAVTFDLEETPVQTLIEEAETSSLFGEQRLIVGKNATFVTSVKSKGDILHQEKALISYLEQPLASNVVVFIANTDALDKRKKITKAIEEHACTLHFKPLREMELLQWLTNHVQQWGVRIENDAARKLIQLVGTSLWLLYHECEKLSTFVGQAGVITLPVVDALVSRTLEHDVFKLTEYVMNHKVAEALRLWEDLLTLSQEPLRILALITRQLRLTLQVKMLSEDHQSDKEIASFLKVHPYPVKLARNEAALFSEKALRTYLLLAVQAEEQIKMGSIDKKIAIERILFYMCDETARIC